MDRVPSPSPEILQRAAQISVLLLDVDGVLTDGKIVYAEYGDELKAFDVQDGAGLVAWHQAGLKSAIITSRQSRIVKRRAKELRIHFLEQGSHDKRRMFERMLRKLRVTRAQVCVVGDDILDLPMLRQAGLSVAVSNAVPDIKQTCHYVTQRPGGQGAVREVIELILKAKGLWDGILAQYL